MLQRLSTLLLALAACETAAPPAPAPSAPVTPAPPAPKVAPVAPRPAARCVGKDATFLAARFLADGQLVACYPESDDEVCWQLDPATSQWSFTSRQPQVTPPERPPVVSVTPTEAQVCDRPGGACTKVPLTGVKVTPDDRLAGATNDARSLVAVWATGPIYVFDLKGARLATIAPWPTPMSADWGPSVFRQAHVLGDTIEARIADTPITSAIRLFDRRGKRLADVLGGRPMDDEAPPAPLGGSRYAFLSFDAPRELVIVDVATGKQLAIHELASFTPEDTALLRVDHGRIWVVGAKQAAWIDIASNRLVTSRAPTCK